MPQVFHPSANVLARTSLALALVSPVLIGAALSSFSRSSYITKVDVPIDQPVPFSHHHHVEELGIDCRYCHDTVERSSFAGIPSTHTCMSCHSQIWTNSPLLAPIRDSYRTGEPVRWNRVAKVPEFVYFDHSIHVNKGIGCNECHGPVNKMQITYKAEPFAMVWCLECHRQPERFIRPRDEVFNMNYRRPRDQMALGRALVEQYGIKKEQLTDCWICHR